jgi:uncharacterized membrane protein YeiH
MIIIVWTGFEFVGAISFAASGAVLAIRKELDLFGVVVLSVITATGGGILRDIIIGNAPPMAFRDATYIMISMATAIVVSYYYRYIHRFRHLIQIFDALGLGAFTATGAIMAIAHEWNTSVVVVTLGVVTGVGGGILRDMLVGQIPMIFQKEIYALASMAGATVLYFVYPFLDGSIPMYICFVITVGIRLACLHWEIHLPVVRPQGRGD